MSWEKESVVKVMVRETTMDEARMAVSSWV